MAQIITVDDLIADIRVMSGLRNNQLFSDEQIEELLGDAGDELYDIVEGSFEHYFDVPFNFTIAQGSNSAVLPDDIKRDNSLTRNPDTSFPETVDVLGSWLERNQAAGVWTPAKRRYFLAGNTLEIFPAALAAGNYRLYYTPQFMFVSGTTLPQAMVPWAVYLKVHASIAIRTSRQQDTSDLERKLQALNTRVTKSVKNRTEAPKQAPITRHGRRGYGAGW